MAIQLGSIKTHLYIGKTKVKKAYLGNLKVYSSGSIVTYHITDSETYQEEVDSDSSCLSPTTFIPRLNGYIFVGWKTDKQANGEILTNKTMGDDPNSLYAVFKKTVILTIYNNSTTHTSLSGDYYFNNGNSLAPKFTVASNTKTGWNFSGWSESAEAGGSIIYGSLNNQPISNSCSLYGVYTKDIIVTFYNYNSSPSIQSGIARYNSSTKTSYPVFTQVANAKSEWDFRGWSTSTSAIGGINYGSINNTQIAESVTLYSVYQRTVYLRYGIDKDNHSTYYRDFTGICYYNSSGNLQPTTFTVSGNLFNNTDKTFLCWSTTNGATEYAPNDVITLDGSYSIFTLVGVWCKPFIFFERDLWESTDSGYALSSSIWDRNNNMDFKTELGPADWDFRFIDHYMQIKVCRTGYNFGRITVWHRNVPTNGCRNMEICVVYKNGYHQFNINLEMLGGKTIEVDPQIFPALITLPVINQDKIDFAIRIQSEQGDERYNLIRIKTIRFY